jgi:hypothetical protein
LRSARVRALPATARVSRIVSRLVSMSMFVCRIDCLFFFVYVVVFV